MPLYNLNGPPRGFLLPDYFYEPEIQPDRYAVNAITEFPASPDWNLGQQTGFVQGNCFSQGGDGSGTGLGYLFATCDSGGFNGIRFMQRNSNGATNIAFGADSSTQSYPYRTSTPYSLTYNRIHHMAFTWDGGLASSGIHLYFAEDAAHLANVDSGGSTFEGSGSILSQASPTLQIGNRVASLRNFNGDIHIVARWNRILHIDELREVQRFTPLVAPHGLTFCYFNRRVWTPHVGVPTLSSAVTLGASSPYVAMARSL